MSNSKYVSYTLLSPNYSVRTAPITKITIHHAACVNCSLAALGSVFATKARQASSNYGIDSNGNVGMFVEEKNRAWTSSNQSNDNQAITIEVINSKGAPNWEVSDKALAALINLCVDICQRNNIKSLNFTGTASGNLTLHKMFANTLCPGPYLEGKMGYIADQVNKGLGKSTTTTTNNLVQRVNISMPVLQSGSNCSEVKTLQRLLVSLGFSVGIYGIDGSFGPATKDAVGRFQNSRGLDADCIVGPDTWNELLRG